MRRRKAKWKETEEPTLSTTGRRLCILRQSLSSEVYYHLFDDPRRMWATSPRCTFPLISDNPPEKQKSPHARTQIHLEFARQRRTQVYYGREIQKIRLVMVEYEKEKDAEDLEKPQLPYRFLSFSQREQEVISFFLAICNAKAHCFEPCDDNIAANLFVGLRNLYLNWKIFTTFCFFLR